MVHSSAGRINAIKSLSFEPSAFSVVHLRDGVPVHVETLSKCLQRLNTQRNLPGGMQLHSFLVLNGLDSLPVLEDHLIDLFSSCGRLQEANQVFLKVQKASVYAWSAIIVAHTRLGKADIVHGLYDEFRKEKLQPTKFIYSSLIKICSDSCTAEEGKIIHDHIVRSGLEADRMLQTMLVNMFINHGNFDEAKKMFEMTLDHDVVSWSTMIAGYTHNGQYFHAIEMFKKMQGSGIAADQFIYSCVLKACGNIKSVQLGKLMHANVIESGYESDVIVKNTIIDMYINCGGLTEAKHVFDLQTNRNAVSWGTMIAGYVQHGYCGYAILLFKKMQREGTYVSRITCIYALKACGSTKNIEEGQTIHDKVIGCGDESDVMVGSALVDMYAKCGILVEARAMLHGLHVKNVFSWNAVISGYTNAGFDHQALEAFEEMNIHGVDPDKATYSCILQACSNIGCLTKGRQMHDQILRKGFQLDAIFNNSLVDMYARCGEIDGARKMFDCFLQKDVGAWSIMIAGYTQHDLNIVSFELFERMLNEGFEPDKTTMVNVVKACSAARRISYGRRVHYKIIVSGLEQDVTVCNSVVDMYAKCGSLVEALKVFQVMNANNVVSWNALIGGYVDHGYNLSALETFDKMQNQGLYPDRVTLSCILRACSGLGFISVGKYVHEKLVENRFQTSIVVGSALVDMYVKCGYLEEACKVFDRMSNHCLVSWAAMIAGYTLQGDGYKALDLYWKMVSEYVMPDKVTLLCMLKACCSTGALIQGQLIHMEIVRCNFETDVDIGSLLVDMYSKLGRLNDAQNVFDCMPWRNIVAWNALIGGYAQQGFWQQARKYMGNMQKEGLTPVHQTYTNLLAACSHAGELEEGQRSLKMIKDETDMDLTVEHLNCIIDLLGRTGCLNEAIKMLRSTPDLPSIIGWTSLLNACKTYGQKDLGKAYFGGIM